MRITFTVNEDIGKAERRAEKRQRREDAKAMKLSRSADRRAKNFARTFFA